MSTQSKSAVSTVSSTANAVQGSTAISTGNIGKGAKLNLQVGLTQADATAALDRVNESIARVEGLYGANGISQANQSNPSYAPLSVGGNPVITPDSMPQEKPAKLADNKMLLLLGGGAALVAILSFTQGK